MWVMGWRMRGRGRKGFCSREGFGDAEGRNVMV